MRQSSAADRLSLVPRLPLSLPSVYVHNNSWERRIGEKPRRPGSIHHVSEREVDVGGGGDDIPPKCTKLESEFLTGQDKYPSR